MKKRRILLLVLAVSLLLCSCGEVKIESITLSKNAAELKEGESVTLSAVVAPENATESYGWKSADESVATVDENGVVTAVAPGNTNILAVSESGKTAACSVTVAAPTAYEQLNDAERELFDYMTGTMLESFYNASAVRIRKIYNDPAGINPAQDIIVDLEGTNRLGGTVHKLYGILRFEDQMFHLPCGDGEIDLSQPMPTDVMDPAKINAALAEYWHPAAAEGVSPQPRGSPGRQQHGGQRRPAQAPDPELSQRARGGFKGI